MPRSNINAGDSGGAVRAALNAMTAELYAAAAARSVSSLAALNAIPDADRVEGMLVYVRANQTTYQLAPGPWGYTTDYDWWVFDASRAYGVPTFTALAIVGQDQRVAAGTTLSGTVTFRWACANGQNVNVAGVTLTDVTTSTVLATGLPASGQQAVTLPAAVTHAAGQSHVWRVSAVDTKGNPAAGDLTVSWVAVSNRTFYVRPDGSDSNTGLADTAGGAFATVRHAANQCLPGDTVRVRAGTYGGFSVGYDFPQGGVAGSPIRFLADPGVVINTRWRQNSAINIENASYVVVDGFRVENNADPTLSVNNAGIRAVGTQAARVRGIEITNNVVTDARWFGVLTGYVDDIVVEGNEVFAIRGAGQNTGHGLYVGNEYTGGLIRYNHVHDCPGDGIHTNGDTGVSSGTVISHNRLINVNTVQGGAGINPDGIQDSFICDNLIVGNSSGITLYRADADGPSTGNVVANNTVILTPASRRSALLVADTSTGNVIKNNVFYNPGLNNGPSAGVISVSQGAISGATPTVFDNNLYILPAASARVRVTDPVTGDILASMTFSQGQFSGREAAGRRADAPAAVFANAAAGDYHLTPASPAVDAGAAVAGAPSTDLDGNARQVGAAVDIGCYEFDTARPYVVSTSPAGGAIEVAAIAVAATFDRAVSVASATFSVTANGNAVAGTTSYNAGAFTWTFTPAAPYPANATVTATVSGVTAVSGGAGMASPATFSFRATPLPDAADFTMWEGDLPTHSGADGVPLELGLYFTPMVSGRITALRMYQHAAGAGAHLLALYTATGTQLATASLANNSDVGWREAALAAAVPVVAGTQYVVSYTTPSGGQYPYTPDVFSAFIPKGPLRADGAGFAVYAGFPATQTTANYFADVVFDPRTPVPGATGVPTAVNPSARFNVPVDDSTIVFTVSGTGGPVSGSVSYDAGTRTASFVPAAPLATSTAHTASVSGAQTVGGHYAMAAAVQWGFTTGTSATGSGQTLFGNTAPTLFDTDGAAIMVGAFIYPSVAGSVLGVRFYKGATNTGTHVGYVWKLNQATYDVVSTHQVTFSGETPSGWQRMDFATPVAVGAGDIFLVGVWMPAGGYGYTLNAFASTVTAGSLNGLADNTVSGIRNGRYGLTQELPLSHNGQATSYWVDVAFQPA